MNAIRPVADRQRRTGMYWLLHLGDACAISAAVDVRGWRFFHLDGRFARQEAFLDGGGRSHGFPGLFGHNWDAFEECVNDLSWAPADGYVLLYDQFGGWRATTHVPGARHAILEEASRRWEKEGVPFYALVRRNPRLWRCRRRVKRPVPLGRCQSRAAPSCYHASTMSRCSLVSGECRCGWRMLRRRWAIVASASSPLFAPLRTR